MAGTGETKSRAEPELVPFGELALKMLTRPVRPRQTREALRVRDMGSDRSVGMRANRGNPSVGVSENRTFVRRHFNVRTSPDRMLAHGGSVTGASFVSTLYVAHPVAARAKAPQTFSAASAGLCIGSVKTIRVNSPIVDSTRTAPPCASTICLTIDRPRPVPPIFRVSVLSTR